MVGAMPVVAIAMIAVMPVAVVMPVAIPAPVVAPAIASAAVMAGALLGTPARRVAEIVEIPVGVETTAVNPVTVAPVAAVSTVSSGLTGSSYGALIPVNSGISPALAFSYRPFGSLCSHTSSGHDTKISTKSAGSLQVCRIRSRSAR